MAKLVTEFQSLLSQGISLLLADGRRPALGDRPFQSLLSQGISLLGDGGFAIRDDFAARFNPFLVRASVYWSCCR